MIVDLHMHVVPRIDDGATDMQTALDMLKVSYNQGVRHIFCTSHNGYSRADADRYEMGFRMLETCSKAILPDLQLHRGTELLCAGEYMDDILFGLQQRIFFPLGTSKYVLTELYSDATPREAERVTDSMIDAGYHPILAHAERYPLLFDGKTLPNLIGKGCSVQVNAVSFTLETDKELKSRARRLLSEDLVSFIGSDAHGITYRPPRLSAGVQYIREHSSPETTNAILYGNAQRIIQPQ